MLDAKFSKLLLCPTINEKSQNFCKNLQGTIYVLEGVTYSYKTYIDRG